MTRPGYQPRHSGRQDVLDRLLTLSDETIRRVLAVLAIRDPELLAELLDEHDWAVAK